MKVNIIITLIICVFVLSSLCVSCGNVMPYGESTLFAKYFPYEGFSQLSNLEYTTNQGHNSIDSYTNNAINAVQSDCAKVYGFDSLFCKPYLADKTLDVFSGVEGNVSCVSGSSGLTNSKGALCLTPQHKMLLSTRGGNSTGRNFEIGQ